jgi:hypothetical protein
LIRLRESYGGQVVDGGLSLPKEMPSAFAFRLQIKYADRMPKETVEIPIPVLSSVESLDELLDWLTAQNPRVIAELREARRQDRAGEFKAWEPRHVQWPTKSK